MIDNNITNGFNLKTLSKSVEEIAKKNNLSDESIKSMKDEIAKIPTQGIKALSKPLIELIKNNIVDLVKDCGEGFSIFFNKLF